MQAIGYVLGAVMIIVGGLMLAGYFEPRFGDPQGGTMLRTMFGLVLLLYGIYRIAVSEMARRRREHDRHINGEP